MDFLEADRNEVFSNPLVLVQLSGFQMWVEVGYIRIAYNTVLVTKTTFWIESESKNFKGLVRRSIQENSEAY